MNKSQIARWIANDLEDLYVVLVNDYAAYGRSSDTYLQDCFEQKLRTELQIRMNVLRKFAREEDVAPRERSVN